MAADGHFTANDEIWRGVADLDVNSSNTYSLYQRRYPRRLPKLGDLPDKGVVRVNESSPKRLTKPSPKPKKIKKVSTPPAEEAMPMPPRDDLFGKRERKKEEVHRDAEKITLEDYQEEEDSSIHFQKADRKARCSVTFNFNKKSTSPNGSPPLARSMREKPSAIRRTSQDGGCSLGGLRRSPPRCSFADPIRTSSPRRKVDLAERSQRSQSLYEPRTRGSPSIFPTERPCSKSSVKESTLEFIAKVKSQKETGSILTKITEVKQKTNLSSARRRHTYHTSSKDEEINRIESVRRRSPETKQTVSKHKQNEQLKEQLKQQHNEKEQSADKENTKTKEKIVTAEEDIVLPKLMKKTSSEIFFCSSLTSDNQMQCLEDVNFVIPSQQTTLNTAMSSQQCNVKGWPISSTVAYTLRMLLFGSCLSSFTESWKEQTISFVQPHHYALKFYKDGPTEIMAPLQAYILKQLLFTKQPQHNDVKVRLSCSGSGEQRDLLLSAMCEMIWTIGKEKHAIVTLPIGKCEFIPEYNYRSDEITEKMELFKFTDRDELLLFIRQNINKFQEIGSYGCLAFLYSLMLTRGLSKLLSDMCEMKHGMLETSETGGRSQSLINLCIYGKAVPNIFNNTLEIYDSELDKIKLHHGIRKRCTVGYLTYMEVVDNKLCEVGSCLKTPRNPIWVLNNDGKLGVLLCVKKELLSDWKLERRFDLYYYQGVARHVPTNEIDIRLTIDTMQPLVPTEEELEECSTLEETIRTKWKDAVIQWNGFTRF